MTKRQALTLLGCLAGGSLTLPAVAAGRLWQGGKPLAATGLATAGAAAAAALLYSRLVPNAPLGGRVFFRGDPEGLQVALTFDDGPRPPFTEAILDILDAEQAPATFFVLGENARRHPETLRRMAAAGHRVANHGTDHAILMFAGRQEVVRQITAADEAIRQAGVADPAPLFRAPHGWLGPAAHLAVRELGYAVAGWTKGVWDTANPGVGPIVSRTAEVLKPGAVLLLHDGWTGVAPEERSQTAAALPAIIRLARERGLEFVTLEALMAGADG